MSSNIASHAKVNVDSTRHYGKGRIAFLCESYEYGWVGFSRTFEANKKLESALRMNSSLVFFFVNLGLLFKSFKNTINCCFRKFRQLKNVLCRVPGAW